MNLMKSVKYGISPEEIERQFLTSERFRILSNMWKIEKTQKLHARLDRYDKKQYSAKRKELREELLIGEQTLVLAERIKKKAAPGKFCKQSVQNISYFNKDRAFIIRKLKPINGIKYYWLKDAQKNRKLPKRFKELNHLVLAVILLCDCVFHCSISSM